MSATPFVTHHGHGVLRRHGRHHDCRQLDRRRRERRRGRGKGRRRLAEQGERRQGEETDERLHGVVAWTAPEDGPGEPEDAQLGDQQAAGGAVAHDDGGGEAAVHRRVEATARHPHDRAPRLQVQTAPPTQDAAEEGPEVCATRHAARRTTSAAGWPRHVRDERDGRLRERLSHDAPRLPPADDGADGLSRRAVRRLWGDTSGPRSDRHGGADDDRVVHEPVVGVRVRHGAVRVSFRRRATTAATATSAAAATPAAPTGSVARKARTGTGSRPLLDGPVRHDTTESGPHGRHGRRVRPLLLTPLRDRAPERRLGRHEGGGRPGGPRALLRLLGRLVRAAGPGRARTHEDEQFARVDGGDDDSDVWRQARQRHASHDGHVSADRRQQSQLGGHEPLRSGHGCSAAAAATTAPPGTTAARTPPEPGGSARRRGGRVVCRRADRPALGRAADDTRRQVACSTLWMNFFSGENRFYVCFASTLTVRRR